MKQKTVIRNVPTFSVGSVYGWPTDMSTRHKLDHDAMFLSQYGGRYSVLNSARVPVVLSETYGGFL